MLHFLATLALCIFIGERLGHYSSVWRLHRDERRYMVELYPPQPTGPPAGWKLALLLCLGGLFAYGLAQAGLAIWH